MAEVETGLKWWMRYVIVPLIGGGGLIAIVVAGLNRPDIHPPSPKPLSNAAVASPNDVQKTVASPDENRKGSRNDAALKAASGKAVSKAQIARGAEVKTGKPENKPDSVQTTTPEIRPVGSSVCVAWQVAS